MLLSSSSSLINILSLNYVKVLWRVVRGSMHLLIAVLVLLRSRRRTVFVMLGSVAGNELGVLALEVFACGCRTGVSRSQHSSVVSISFSCDRCLVAGHDEGQEHADGAQLCLPKETSAGGLLKRSLHCCVTEMAVTSGRQDQQMYECIFWKGRPPALPCLFLS